jgi:hypothetical protein
MGAFPCGCLGLFFTFQQSLEGCSIELINAFSIPYTYDTQLKKFILNAFFAQKDNQH